MSKILSRGVFAEMTRFGHHLVGGLTDEQQARLLDHDAALRTDVRVLRKALRMAIEDNAHDYYAGGPGGIRSFVAEIQRELLRRARKGKK